MSIEGGGISGGVGGGIGGGVGAVASVGSGIEGGGLAGAASVSGPSIAAPSFEAAPAVTGPVNEGPLSLAALKLTVPMGEITFNQPLPMESGFTKADVTESLSVEAAVTEADAIISQAQKPPSIQVAEVSKINRPILPLEPLFFPQPWPGIEPVGIPNNLEFSQPQAAVSPAVEPLVQPGLQLEDQVFNEARPVVLTQPALENQEVQEEAVAERVTVKKIDTVGEEKIIKKKKFVVDQTTLANRLQKVVEAARQAKPEAERLGLGKKIIGWIVDKYFSLSHSSYMSKAVQPEGPDGTIAITEETIKAKAEFESEQEVESVVLDNIPVSEEEDGEPVSDEQVRKVFQDRIVKPSKPGRPLELVEKRVVQKEQKSLRQPEAKKENNLRDLGLAEIFPKAA